MLHQRIITASILAPLIILAIFYLPIEYFSLLWGCIILIAAWEWTGLSGLKNPIVRVLFLLILVFSMFFIHYWTVFLEILAEIFSDPLIKKQSGLLEWFVIGPVIWWILIMLLIRNASGAMLKLQLKTIYKLLIGWLILVAAWMFLTRLHSFYGSEMTMYFFLLIWAADIAAYFTGKRFGRVKLAPEISPGKTVEGLYGALVAAVVSGLCLGLYWLIAYGNVPLMVMSDFILLSLITVLISVYGDLFVSLIKRQRGVKDTGSLLPGHGGLLDRLDSVIAAIPVFYAGIVLIYLSISS